MLVVDSAIALKAVKYQLQLVEDKFFSIYRSNPAVIDLDIEQPKLDGLYSHGKGLFAAIVTLTKTGNVPAGTSNSTIRDYIVDALDSYRGFILSKQVDGDKRNELHAISETKTGVQAIT